MYDMRFLMMMMMKKQKTTNSNWKARTLFMKVTTTAAEAATTAFTRLQLEIKPKKKLNQLEPTQHYKLCITKRMRINVIVNLFMLPLLRGWFGIED